MTAEQAAVEIQRIAEICGAFSLGGCGIVQYRATFAPWKERGDTMPTVVVVDPIKVEGIYEQIWRRLQQRPEYEPLKHAVYERDRAVAAQGDIQAKFDAAASYITVLEFWRKHPNKEHASAERDIERARKAWEASL